MIIGFNALLRQGVALCLIATPLCALLYDPNVIFPFITPKAFAFHALVLCELVMSSVLLMTDQQLREKLFLLSKSKIFKSYLIYFLFISISGFLAENSLVAMWGSPERADGIYLRVFCIYSMLIGSLLLNYNHWRLLFLTIIITGIILLFFQWGQYTRNVTRPGSLLNQPTFLASFYIFAIASCFLLNALIVQLKFRLIVYFLALGLTLSFVIGIIISGTRSSLLAVVFSFLVVYLWHFKKNITSQTIGIATILALLLIFVCTLNFSIDGTDAISRLISITKNYSSVESRLINVEISLSSMSPLHSSIKSFLFGWGWNNYYLAWDASYLPSINKFDPAPFDKSHNTYIDAVVMIGLFGFLAFINYLYFIFIEIKNIKHRKIKIPFVFLFIAVLVQYLFTFDSLIDVMMFNIFASFLIFTEIQERLTC